MEVEHGMSEGLSEKHVFADCDQIRLKPDCSAAETRHEVIKVFSFSTQLSTKFQLPIKTQLSTNEEVFCFKSLKTSRLSCLLCFVTFSNVSWSTSKLRAELAP